MFFSSFSTPACLLHPLSSTLSPCLSLLAPPSCLLCFRSLCCFLPQVAALQEEKSSLLAENQVLMERLNQSDSIEDVNSPAGRRHLQLQTQLEQLQEETFRCGAAAGTQNQSTL